MMIRSVLAPSLIRRVSPTGITLSLKRPTVVRYMTSKDDAGNTNVQEIRMPEDLGVGKIAQWHAAVGDIIKYDDVFVDIETPDFTFGMSHDEDESVKLIEIVAQVGDNVLAGDLVCVFLRGDGNEDNSKTEPVEETSPKTN